MVPKEIFFSQEFHGQRTLTIKLIASRLSHWPFILLLLLLLLLYYYIPPGLRTILLQCVVLFVRHPLNFWIDSSFQLENDLNRSLLVCRIWILDWEEDERKREALEFLLSTVVEIQSMLEVKLIHSSVLIAARESRQNLLSLPSI